MALTRSHLRQLAYQLEFAPLGTPIRTRSTCCLNYKNRVNQSQQRLQTSYSKANVRSATFKSSQHSLSDLIQDIGPGSKSKSKTRTQAQTDHTQTRSTEYAGAESLARLDQALSDARLPLQRDRAVTEKQALDSLRVCFEMARIFNEMNEETKALTPAMEALFTAEDGHTETQRVQAAVRQAASVRNQAIERIVETAHKLITDPKVYITEDILKLYVIFKGYLDRPEDLAEVFQLYANKPVPVPGASPIEYKPASPDQVASAVPLEIAQAALDSAVSVRDLNLCMDIIEQSVCTTAFRRRKLFSQALIPSAGVVFAPFGAYLMASQFAVFQDHMGTDTARSVGFAGITSYFLFTGTIGFVALTTSNDQMQRVTWAGGLPLRQRWMREPERAMMDRLACSWGLKNKHRWGEEEGPEWSALRELIRNRGMWLDKVELMEGMS